MSATETTETLFLTRARAIIKSTPAQNFSRDQTEVKERIKKDTRVGPDGCIRCNFLPPTRFLFSRT